MMSFAEQSTGSSSQSRSSPELVSNSGSRSGGADPPRARRSHHPPTRSPTGKLRSKDPARDISRRIDAIFEWDMDECRTSRSARSGTNIGTCFQHPADQQSASSHRDGACSPNLRKAYVNAGLSWPAATDDESERICATAAPAYAVGSFE